MKSNTNTPPVRLADDDGNIMTSIQWNLDTFSKYFQSIFHRPDLPCDFRGSQDINDEELPFTTQEVTSAISKQKKGGAVGPDGVSAEMLRAAKDLLSPWLASFFNAIQSVGYCPDDMRSGLVVPVYKPGKPLGKPKSYRPIMLLSVVRKVLTSVITKRSTDDITVYVSETQAGFRPGRSTADGVFYTRSLCERALLGNWTYSVTLLDFSGAFDTIIRTTALDRLEEADISTTTIKSLLSNTTARITVSGSLSPPFPTTCTTTKEGGAERERRCNEHITEKKQQKVARHCIVLCEVRKRAMASRRL
eukprot:scpid40674/ scgid21348/ LINE-1 reverse transcriptase homolog